MGQKVIWIGLDELVKLYDADRRDEIPLEVYVASDEFIRLGELFEVTAVLRNHLYGSGFSKGCKVSDDVLHHANWLLDNFSNKYDDCTDDVAVSFFGEMEDRWKVIGSVLWKYLHDVTEDEIYIQYSYTQLCDDLAELAVLVGEASKG